MKETNEFNNLKAWSFHSSIFNEVNNNSERESGQISNGEKYPTEPIALSHTKTEQRLYELMLAETQKTMTKVGVFSTRYLMVQTGIHNYSSVRRAQIGLVNKLSIERHKTGGDSKSSAVRYVVYSPSEIIARRREAGFNPYPKEPANADPENSTGRIIERLVQRQNLSRRQAQVALKCAEGLSNAEIGAKLLIRQETVKFHLRNVFIKFGVKRRTELIAYLFLQELTGLAIKKLNED
ncbi:MAG TPA: helix-turn-helix transcriptional regulator [Pyrinomonadaceae bacterium]|nr:helix-turn-helix transcriptional regulator [Pyrinomonadaceae bacterium]